MKSLQEVKEHFKNAKEVRCFEDRIVSINIENITHGKNHPNNFYHNINEWNSIKLYDNITKKLAEIISYKENPITHDDFNEYTKEIEVPVRDCVIDTPKHYDNSKGTLYKVANERGWNSYIFDIVKRLERAEKKGEFKSDLQKSINVIQLWLKESKND